MFRVNINLSVNVETFEDAARLVRGIHAPGFVQDVSVFSETLIAPPPTPAPEQEEVVVATPKPTRVSKPKPVVDPAPAPASAAPAEPDPVPAPAPASEKPVTHVDLRAILTPAATSGRQAEVNKFITGLGYFKIDQIPLTELAKVVAAAKELFK